MQRQHAEGDDAAEQRDAAARVRSPTTPPMKPPNIMPTMPLVSAGVSAERGTFHSRISAGMRRDEHLVVEAVEDDGQRRREDQQLLIAAPLALVEHRADVNGFHGTSNRRWTE